MRNIPRGLRSESYKFNEYILRTHEGPPEGMYQVNWNDDLQFPFELQTGDYDPSDEYVVRYINTVPVVLFRLQVSTDSLRHVVNKGGTYIHRRAKLHDEYHEDNIDLAIWSSHRYQTEHDTALSQLVSTYLTFEEHDNLDDTFSQWLMDCRARAQRVCEVFDSVVNYDVGDGRGDVTHHNTIPDEDVSDELVTRFEEYEETIHELELGELVNDAYKGIEEINISV